MARVTPDEDMYRTTIPVTGKVTARVSPRGLYLNGRKTYKGENVDGVYFDNLAALREFIAKADQYADEARAATREMAKAAATQPPVAEPERPAPLTESYAVIGTRVEKVTVRARDGRNPSKVRVTLPDGTKDAVYIQALFDCTDEEAATINAALAAARQALTERRAAENVGVSGYSARSEVQGDVTLSYNADDDRWVAVTADGEQFTGPTPTVGGRALDALAAREFPFRVTDDQQRIVPATEEPHGRRAFRTEADAQAYVDAVRAEQATEAAKYALLAAHRRDPATVVLPL